MKSQMKKSKEEAKKEEPKKEDPKKKVKKPSEKKNSFFRDEKFRFVMGILFTGLAVYLLIAFISYLFTWNYDQSVEASLSAAGEQAKNLSGKIGHIISEFFISNGFGVGAFFIPLIIAALGLTLLKFPNIRFWKLTFRFTFAAVILSLILGYASGEHHTYLGGGLGGAQGYFATKWMNAVIGKIGTGVLLIFVTITFLVFGLNVSPSAFHVSAPSFLKKKEAEPVSDDSGTVEEAEKTEDMAVDEEDDIPENETEHEIFRVIRTTPEPGIEPGMDGDIYSRTGGSIIRDLEGDKEKVIPEISGIPINITRAEATDRLSEEEAQKIMDNYDPTGINFLPFRS